MYLPIGNPSWENLILIRVSQYILQYVIFITITVLSTYISNLICHDIITPSSRPPCEADCAASLIAEVGGKRNRSRVMRHQGRHKVGWGRVCGLVRQSDRAMRHLTAGREGTRVRQRWRCCDSVRSVTGGREARRQWEARGG